MKEERSRACVDVSHAMGGLQKSGWLQGAWLRDVARAVRVSWGPAFLSADVVPVNVLCTTQHYKLCMLCNMIIVGVLYACAECNGDYCQRCWLRDDPSHEPQAIRQSDSDDSDGFFYNKFMK